MRSLTIASTAACVLLIGMALVPRDPGTGANINDLQTNKFYFGRSYSNGSQALQSQEFKILAETKTGNRFTGQITFQGKDFLGIVGGKVDAKGKFTMSKPGLKLTGKLSAGGVGILGTYQATGATPDKGTFWVEVSNVMPCTVTETGAR